MSEPVKVKLVKPYPLLASGDEAKVGDVVTLPWALGSWLLNQGYAEAV